MATRHAATVFLAASFTGLALAACGSDDVSGPAQTVSSRPAVATDAYVASPTLGAASTARLFTLPGLGRFRAHCRGGARAEISYRTARRGTDQIVTTEHRLGSSSRRLKPGRRLAVGIGRQTGPRVEWRIAFISEGRIELATAAISVGPLSGNRGCFVSGAAEVAARRR
jgi:hypothetical protein